MRRNIVFDFGNVLVEWHPERVYGEFFGDEARAWWFLCHVVDMDFRQRIDAGESMDACIREKQQQYPDYANAIGLYRSRWREMLTGEVPGMRVLLNALRVKGYEVYGLTNWSMETFPEARKRFGILQLVDRYVVSGAEGYVKPDPRLFQVLLDRYHLQAEDCTFVDDNADNVGAARTLGMEGIVFQGADDLKERLGVLDFEL
ncbi:MAG: HAD family phosphatase [Bacteroidales bacterium]|nr:HAD family phosphatase [Bacteroidales bacterium]